MALPARLKSTLRPLGTLGKAIGPTGIGVLMSIGAHAVLIAASAQGSGGGADGSGGLFGAFDEMAEEEKIVPIVQLTPAERSRLPAFAQPRRDPLNPSSLGSLDLPPGLIAPSASLGQRRTSVPAARMPSATTPRQFAATPPIDDVLKQIRARVAAAPRPQPPVSTNVPRRTPTSAYIQTKPAVIVPPPPANGVNSGSTTTSSGSAADLGQPSAGSGLPRLEAQSTEDILIGLQESQGQPRIIPEMPTAEGENSSEPAIPPETNNSSSSEGIDIPIENSGSDKPTTLALEPANGDASALKDELTHDARLTSPEEVTEKVEAWSESVVEQKGTLPQAESEVEINAAFKACRDNPPIDGLMGVVVNPDGEIETLDVLRSTGYETLNLRAKEAVENFDFSNVNETTDYRVNIKVNYDAEGCVDTEGLRKRLLE